MHWYPLAQDMPTLPPLHQIPPVPLHAPNQESQETKNLTSKLLFEDAAKPCCKGSSGAGDMHRLIMYTYDWAGEMVMVWGKVPLCFTKTL